MLSSFEDAAKRIARQYASRAFARSLETAAVSAKFMAARAAPLLGANAKPPSRETDYASFDAAEEQDEAVEGAADPQPSSLNDPYYDQWLRVRSGTRSAAIVDLLKEAISDVRARRPEEGKPLRKRKAADQATYDVIAEALTANLLRRELVRPGAWTRITLGHSRYSPTVKHQGRAPGGRARVASRYHSPAIAPAIRKVLDELEQRGVVMLSIGRIDTQERVPSFMRAGAVLIRWAMEKGATLSDFHKASSEPPLILKDRRPKGYDGRGRLHEANRIDYRDTRETDRMADEMRDLNAWLASADIKYLSNSDGVDFINERALRRIFNNGTFAEGGRLYGGFWMRTTMSSDKAWNTGEPFRGNIRIEGEPVVVVDFSSMLLRLLYVEAGLQPPAGDLYAAFEKLGPEHREALKRVVSAMLFRTSSLIKFPRSTRLLFPKGWSVRRVEKAILKRHAPVAHLFYRKFGRNGSAIGHRLFRRESDIIVRALCEFKSKGIVALPVHDAVIVKESCGETAREIMLAAFKQETGFEGQVGESKAPGADTVSLDTVLSASGELPEHEHEREAALKTVERLYDRKEAVRIAKSYVPEFPETAETPEGADGSDLW